MPNGYIVYNTPTAFSVKNGRSQKKSWIEKKFPNEMIQTKTRIICSIETTVDPFFAVWVTKPAFYNPVRWQKRY